MLLECLLGASSQGDQSAWRDNLIRHSYAAWRARKCTRAPAVCSSRPCTARARPHNCIAHQATP
jgi:hypothetical protein